MTVTHETAVWLNRAAIILGFVSFWFVAPEFVGEQRLKSWEQFLSKYLSRIPKALRLVFGICTAVVIIGYFVMAITRWSLPNVSNTVLMIFAILSASVTVAPLLIPPLVRKLANDSSVRQTSFFFGAGLFTVASILQFVATFE